MSVEYSLGLIFLEIEQICTGSQYKLEKKTNWDKLKKARKWSRDLFYFLVTYFY